MDNLIVKQTVKIKKALWVAFKEEAKRQGLLFSKAQELAIEQWMKKQGKQEVSGGE